MDISQADDELNGGTQTGPASWLDAFYSADERTIPASLVRSRDPEPGPYTREELGLSVARDGNGPLVSVVIPTYRDSEYLPDALASVDAQTYGNLEVVLVDSSGVAWVEELAGECDWIRYYSREPRGVAAARNDGIERASGRYVALLDADDYWHPEKLAWQVSALEDGANASFTSYYFVKFWGNETPVVQLCDRTLEDTEHAYVETVKRTLRPHTSTLVFHEAAVPERPFRESLENFEDVVFAVELFREHPPAHVPTPCSVRRLRDDSLSDRTAERAKFEYRMASYGYLENEYPELGRDVAKRTSKEAFDRGWAMLENGNRTEARRCFERSVRAHPRNYRALGLFLATLVPADGEQTAGVVERVFETLRPARADDPDGHRARVSIQDASEPEGRPDRSPESSSDASPEPSSGTTLQDSV